MKITNNREGFDNKSGWFFAENEKRAIKLFLLSEFWLLKAETEALVQISDLLTQLFSSFLLTVDINELDLSINVLSGTILRIINASLSESKKIGLIALINYLNTIYGHSVIKDAQAVRIFDEEPAAADAIAVARHKLQSSLTDLKERLQQSTLYPELNGLNILFAGDVVAGVSPLEEVDGELVVDKTVEATHLLNLSRVTDRGEQVKVREFKDYLKKLYSAGPFQLTYLIANATTMLVRQGGSEEGMQISEVLKDTGIRLEIQFDALPEKFIDEYFAKIGEIEMADAVTLEEGGIKTNVNVGLPLFDSGSPFLQYIRKVSIEPLREITELGDNSIENEVTTQDQIDSMRRYRRISTNTSDLDMEELKLLHASLERWIVNGVSPSAPTLFR